jgi:nicotinamidase-related amidase
MSAALLLMDLQVGVLDRYPEEKRTALLDRAMTAKAAARAAGVLVVSVRLAFRDDTPEVSPRNLLFTRVAEMGGFGERDAGTRLHPAVAPEAGDVVVLKQRASAFSGSDLGVVLRARDITHLVLVGLATSGVVLSTLREAADLDYGLIVLADACADHDDEVHRVLCEKVFPLQATVTTVDEWAAAL